jgi:peptidoglycan/xylan/chitin deacetylase (PgdA/CDA1 family)
MTIGVRKLCQFSAVLALFLLAEALLAAFCARGGVALTPLHLALSGAVLLAAAAVGHRLMYRRRPRKVPVLMYHSVADFFPEFPEQQIVMSTGLFEYQLSWLTQRGFETLHLHQLQDGLEGKAELPRRAICLTFDDGMLDNWVNVYPLLRKYGMKATFFIPTDFIGEGGDPRPTLEDVWQGRVQQKDLQWTGYLNWNEVAAMQESGLVEFMPHGCTHDWAFTGDEIIDFHHPGDDLFWLDWLDHPERKREWMENPALWEESLGRPVYRHDRSLVSPLWHEDPGLRAHCEAHVRHGGGRAFFNRSDWRKQLHGAAREYRAGHAEEGRRETEEEYRTRVLDELQRSRRMVRARTGGDVDFFCWPGERFSEASLQLALGEAGYRAVTCDFGENVAGRSSGLIGRKIAQEVFAHWGLPWLDRLLFRVNVRALEGNYYAYLLEFPLNRFKDVILRHRSRGKQRQSQEGKGAES